MKTIQANTILNIRRYSLFEISQKGIVLCSGSVIDALCCLEKRWLGSRRLSRGRSQRTAVSKCKSMHIHSHSWILYINCVPQERIRQHYEGNLLRVYPFIHSQAYACMQDRSLELHHMYCTSPVPCIRHLII